MSSPWEGQEQTRTGSSRTPSSESSLLFNVLLEASCSSRMRSWKATRALAEVVTGGDRPVTTCAMPGACGLRGKCPAGEARTRAWLARDLRARQPSPSVVQGRLGRRVQVREMPHGVDDFVAGADYFDRADFDDELIR